MVVITLATFKTLLSKVREFIFGQTGLATKASGTRMICRDQGYFNGLMVVVLKASLEMELCMAMEFTLGRMAGGMKETTILIKNKAKELILTLMVVSIKEIGLKVNSMV